MEPTLSKYHFLQLSLEIHWNSIQFEHKHQQLRPHRYDHSKQSIAWKFKNEWTALIALLNWMVGQSMIII